MITDLLFRRWDGWVDGMRNHIFVMSAEGGIPVDITRGDADSPTWTEDGTEEIAFSPDSNEICVSRCSEGEAITGNNDPFVISGDGGSPEAVTKNKSTDRTQLYSPDGPDPAYSNCPKTPLEIHYLLFLRGGIQAIQYGDSV